MATYKFDNLNGGVEIVDPTIAFPNLTSYNLQSKIGSIECVLEIPGAIMSVVLKNVNIPTVNQGTVNAKGMLALAEFEV